MEKMSYQPETPQKIVNLSPSTPDEIQEYLQLCLEISQPWSEHNILEFPYDFAINPYAILYRWLKQAHFQISPKLTEFEVRRLRYFAKFYTKDFRGNTVSSTVIFHPVKFGPPETINPFLQNFSKIYTANQLFDSLHTYNFLLENYIHETNRLCRVVNNDVAMLNQSWCLRQHHTLFYCYHVEREYNFWVRNFLLCEGIDHGSAPFTQYAYHNFQQNFQRNHPILRPADRSNVINTFLEKQKLALKLKRYRYYRFLQSTPAEANFFCNLRNDHNDFNLHNLLGTDPEKLRRAVDLAGHINQHITFFCEHRSVIY